MVYQNRNEAAIILAGKLEKFRKEDGIVLAIPAGGVPIGSIVAGELDFPLEPAMSKKIGHPFHKEFAIGAVTLHGTMIQDNEMGVDKEYIHSESESILRSLKEKFRMFMGSRIPTPLKGKTVILVDDGIATGNTIISIIGAIRKQRPARIIVAVPVSPPSAARKITALADEFICPLIPEDFDSVGQYYMEFKQISDEEVINELSKVNAKTLR
jgi:putative phosphoribosyl transferase